MSHPILVTALAENRRRRCPCGAVAPLTCGPCCKCRTAAAWRHEFVRTSRFGAAGYAPARITTTRLLSWITPLLQIISKGAEN